MREDVRTGTTSVVFGTLMHALAETLVMVVVPATIALVVGLPLGGFLALGASVEAGTLAALARALAAIVTLWEAIPFVLVLIAVVPVTRCIAGTSIGAVGAIVPLTLATIPAVAALARRTVRSANAAPAFVIGMTSIVVALIEAALVAGAVSGGGFGDLAIRYGFERFDIPYVVTLIAIGVALVLAVRIGGDQLARRFRRVAIVETRSRPLSVEPALQPAGQTRD